MTIFKVNCSPPFLLIEYGSFAVLDPVLRHDETCSIYRPPKTTGFVTCWRNTVCAYSVCVVFWRRTWSHSVLLSMVGCQSSKLLTAVLHFCSCSTEVLQYLDLHFVLVTCFNVDLHLSSSVPETHCVRERIEMRSLDSSWNSCPLTPDYVPSPKPVSRKHFTLFFSPGYRSKSSDPVTQPAAKTVWSIRRFWESRTIDLARDPLDGGNRNRASSPRVGWAAKNWRC